MDPKSIVSKQTKMYRLYRKMTIYIIFLYKNVSLFRKMKKMTIYGHFST